jgi:prophage antirepressor-like protein
MSNNIVAFYHPTLGFHIEAMTDEQGEPWFVASKVAKALGYRNAPDMTRRLDSEDVTTRSTRTERYSHRQVIVIKKSGLYAAVLGSQLRSAKAFKRWVTSEVLPSIRKNGGYIVGQERLNVEGLDAQFVADAFHQTMRQALSLSAQFQGELEKAYSVRDEAVLQRDAAHWGRRDHPGNPWHGRS